MESELENTSDNDLKEDRPPSNQEDRFSEDESDFNKDESPKCEERFAHSNAPRSNRAPRFQGPMFRPNNRPPFPGYRGPRMSMHGPGNHGPGFMRPGMGPNRNGPPFDGYGPHHMGMVRGPPPRHFQPCFNPAMDNHDEEMDESLQPYREMNHDFDGPPTNPNQYPNAPNMRPRGPPPYMMGPHGGPHQPGPHNMPHAGPPGGPNGPFHGPPRPQYGGPPFNPHGGPGPGGPPFGPGGPHHGNAPPGHYGGPPGPNPMGREQCFGGPNPAPQDFNGPPGHFNGPPYATGPGPFAPSRPPFNSGPPPALPGTASPASTNTPSSGPLLPPPNLPPSNTPSAGPCPPPNLQNPPPGPPFNPSDGSAPPGFPGPVPPFSPVRPPTSFQNAPPAGTPATPVSSMNGTISAPPTSSCGPPATMQGPVSESSPFAAPPGYQNAAAMIPPPMMMPQPMAPAPLPLHMMPPPMQAVPVTPPSLPAFRPPVPFMSPAVPLNSASASTQPGSQQKSDEIWVENLTAEGKSYYYNMRTRETRWDRPEGVTVVRQGEVESAGKPLGVAVGAQPVLQKPPDVAVWSEYRNPEGKAYYHNAQTGETTWEKPKVLSDWEAFQSKASTQPTVQPAPANPVPVTQTTAKVEEKPAVSLVTPTVASETKNVSESKTEPTKTESASATKANAVNDSTNEKAESKPPKDSSRPVSSTPVPGTPWCVVWTGDDRAFFYNPSQHLSVWEKPDELKGRVDVDRLLEKRPDIAAKLEAESTDKAKTAELDNGESQAKKPRLEDEQATAEIEDTEDKPKPMESTDTEPEKPISDKIPVGMEAAREAEERAARERATQPLELRVRRFRELLVEKQVSAFSTWEKELHKIVFDPRYLLLTSKERRQTFEIYVKERAEDERREKKNKMKERKEKFLEMLEEANLSAKSSFSDFSSKYSKDERFKAIEKSRDRETMFQDYLADLRKREKEDKHRDKDDKRDKKKKADFIELLREQKNITRHSHWSDVKRKIDSDPRYKAVEASSRREDWFRDYVKKLDEASPTREDSGSRREREKRERQEASIREREREVKEALSSSLKEREAEREQQLLIEQRQNFQAMLAELIRDPSVSWKEAKKILKKDSRWELANDVLQRSERDRIFEEHLDNLTRKMRELKGLNDSQMKDKRFTNDTDSIDSDRRSTSSLKDGDRR